MRSTSSKLTKSAQGKSNEFNRWVKDRRAKVYGGCGASIFLGPFGVAACYSIGAGVLETEINNYRKEVERFTRDFNSWASTFN